MRAPRRARWRCSADDTGYDVARALFPADLLGWFADTLPEQLAKVTDHVTLLDRPVIVLDGDLSTTGGTLHALRRRVRHRYRGLHPGPEPPLARRARRPHDAGGPEDCPAGAQQHRPHRPAGAGDERDAFVTNLLGLVYILSDLETSA